MSGSKSLTWNGDALKARMRAAQKYGVNKVMSECVKEAKISHPWQDRTFVLQGSIGIANYAVENAQGVSGTWGSQDAKYALIHELGGTIVPVKAKALRFRLPNGQWVFATKVTIPPRPYLRPAADKLYPTLAGHMRDFLDRHGGRGAGHAAD